MKKLLITSLLLASTSVCANSIDEEIFGTTFVANLSEGTTLILTLTPCSDKKFYNMRDALAIKKDGSTMFACWGIFKLDNSKVAVQYSDGLFFVYDTKIFSTKPAPKKQD